ncbi:MAG TPA: hypothetical protein VM553_14100, partial [Dongiaceae bacterium]|nr:hypothetical protein [Dongiaceae bacterium]
MTYIRNSTVNSGENDLSQYGKSSQTSTAKATSAASTVLQTAEKRVRTEVDRTTTLLSSLGKLKSTVADTLSAARGLSGFSATTTPEQMKAGISQLVSA